MTEQIVFITVNGKENGHLFGGGGGGGGNG